MKQRVETKLDVVRYMKSSFEALTIKAEGFYNERIRKRVDYDLVTLTAAFILWLVDAAIILPLRNFFQVSLWFSSAFPTVLPAPARGEKLLI